VRGLAIVSLSNTRSGLGDGVPRRAWLVLGPIGHGCPADTERVPILAPVAPGAFPVDVPVVALVASAGGLDALTRVV
jgi:hypothetical protein